MFAPAQWKRFFYTIPMDWVNDTLSNNSNKYQQVTIWQQGNSLNTAQVTGYWKHDSFRRSSQMRSLSVAWWESKVNLPLLKFAWEDLRSSRALPPKRRTIAQPKLKAKCTVSKGKTLRRLMSEKWYETRESPKCFSSAPQITETRLFALSLIILL